jgi:DNA helicase TIP49 (TBP-interacting protein)
MAYFEHNNGQLANMNVVNQDVIETDGNIGKIDVAGQSQKELQEIFKLAQQAAKL